MSSVAPKSPAAMPPPVSVARDTTSPVLVTTVTVEVEVAESSDRMMMIGMLANSLKKVVNRSSFSG